MLPALAIALDVTQIYGSHQCKTKGCFVVIVVVEMRILGGDQKTKLGNAGGINTVVDSGHTLSRTKSISEQIPDHLGKNVGKVYY